MGSMTFRTRLFNSLVSGKLPSILRSQMTTVAGGGGGGDGRAPAASEPPPATAAASASIPVSVVVVVVVVVVVGLVSSDTMNVPPVLGWRATSPRAVEKVDRSSCAYCTIRSPQLKGAGLSVSLHFALGCFGSRWCVTYEREGGAEGIEQGGWVAECIEDRASLGRRTADKTGEVDVKMGKRKTTGAVA